MILMFHNMFGRAGMPSTETQWAAQETWHGTTDFAGQTLGTDRPPSSTGQTAQEQWASSGSQSTSSNGHSVRFAHRDSLGVPSPGNGLRQRYDLLATPARLATSGHLAKHARTVTCPLKQGRSARLVSRGSRQRIGTRPFWGQKTGPNPTDRGKAGSKHHILTDAQGIPLCFTLTGANAHDVTQLLPLVEAVPSVRGKRGRPRHRPDSLQADRGYDSEPHRKILRSKHIKPVIPKRNTEHGSGLGTTRWVVERTLAWLHQFRRLRVRYEKRADIHEAFLTIGCFMICYNFIKGFC